MGESQPPFSISMRDPTTGMPIFKAPSPGGRVEVEEMPETPTSSSGASEVAPGPADPGQPSNSHLAAEVRDEIVKVLRQLEPTTLQEAKKRRLLNRLDLNGASANLLQALKSKIHEIKLSRPGNIRTRREKAIQILEDLIRNWN